VRLSPGESTIRVNGSSQEEPIIFQYNEPVFTGSNLRGPEFRWIDQD
jgi:hypothetical protein